LFIFRGVLRAAPRVEIEALDPNSWSTRGLADQVNKDWTPMPVSPPLVAYTPAKVQAAAELLARAVLNGCPLQRLAIRRTEPNLEVQWHLDPLRKHSARTVFETLQRIAL
jgi:hypothetical protein